jgi:hypothetical protein
MLRAQGARVEGSRAGGPAPAASDSERGHHRVSVDGSLLSIPVPVPVDRLTACERSVGRGAETDEGLLEEMVVVNQSSPRPGSIR